MLSLFYPRKRLLIKNGGKENPCKVANIYKTPKIIEWDFFYTESQLDLGLR